ncbi:GAF domain-containing protein [Chloroflexota bacterium]
MNNPFVLLSSLLLASTVSLVIWQFYQSGKITTLRRRADSVDDLAGFGQAILGAQLKLSALCEVIYQQADRIIDTTNFQLGIFDDEDYLILVWTRHNDRLPTQRFPRAANEGLVGWVRRSGETLIVSDFAKEWEELPAQPRYHSERPSQSALFAPLVVGGNVIGLLTVQSDTSGTFDAVDLRLLMVFTNQAAGAIQNAQLFEQTQEHNRQLQLVSEVSQQLTAIQPLYSLFEQIVGLIWQTFGYYSINLFTVNEQRGHLQLEATTHPAFKQQNPTMDLGEGLVGWSAENGRTALAADVAKDDRYLDDGILQETRSEVAIPLIVERRVVGVLDVQSNLVSRFEPDDVAILETLASQIALAIQEAETYAAERRQRERLRALTETSRAVVSILSVDELLEEVIDLLTDYFGYDRTHIFLRDGDNIVFRAGSGVHSGRWNIEKLAYPIDAPGLITRGFRSGQPIVCNDITASDEYIPGPGVEDTCSEMVIPIRMGAQVLGVLDVQSTEINAFSPDDATLAEALADTMAIALRNATLYLNEAKRRKLAESLREVGLVLSSSLEVDQVLDGILEQLDRLIIVDAAVIVLFDEDTAAYRVSAIHGNIPQDALLERQIPLDADIAVVLQAQCFTSQTEPLQQTHECYLVPLAVGADSLGYLALSHTRGKLTSDDLEIINAFAIQSALAIANAQLYMTEREEAWVSTALLQVAESTGRATSLNEVLRTVARITPLLVGVQWCAVLLAEGDIFRVVEIAGATPQIETTLLDYMIQPGQWEPLATLIESGQPVTLEHHTLNLPDLTPLERPPTIEQGVMLPLFAKGTIVGALLIGQQDQGKALNQRKIELVSGIANQAALAIESAQLYAAQQEEAWVTTALLQVAEAVNAQVDLRSTLETVARLTALLVGVHHCIVLRWSEERGVFCEATAYGLPLLVEKELALIDIIPNQHPFFNALRTRTTPLTAGGATGYAIPPILQGILDTTAVLGLPLTAHGRLVGIMIVDQPHGKMVADERRMNILAGIASQTALAIETTHLQMAAAERQRLEKELEVAQNIQTSFLPDVAPTLPGWDLDAYYRAARMVGGDFYDFLDLPNGKWGLIIADVADKGMPAALYMALCRTMLRAVARNRANPAAALRRVNKLLLEDTRSDLFVTIWYAIWDPADGALLYSSAGHNPPFILPHNGGEPPVLKLKGIALGVIPHIKLNTAQITMQPGDTLVMYTDGITEAQNSADQQFGLDSLYQTTQANHRNGAEATIAAVVAALDEHTGSAPQFDDLTLVVLHRETD